MGQITALLSQLGVVRDDLLVLFALFAGTYLIVSMLLTRPMGNLLVERDDRTAGRQIEISQTRIELAEIVDTLATERKKAAAQASAKFAELKTQAVSEQRKLLTEAREEFAGKVKAARDKIEKSLQDERQKLERSSHELKDELVAKLLGISANKNHSVGKEI
jgi:F0F1-type ATP synthase membrane subunit b/b'